MRSGSVGDLGAETEVESQVSRRIWSLSTISKSKSEIEVRNLSREPEFEVKN